MQDNTLMSASDGVAKERADIGSFSFKTTNPVIQEELTRRATSGKNVEVYMPSIRLSSTIFPGLLNDEYKDCKYFCVGTHGYPENPNSQTQGTKNDLMMDIFSVNDGSYPIVGYTIQKKSAGTHAKIIRAKDESARNLSVPPPGITELTISRNTNGRITKLNGTIAVPSYAQYQVLFDNFLIPGIGILAEVANVRTNDSTFQEPIPFIDLGGIELETMSKIGNNNPTSVPYIPLEKIIEKSVESKGAYTAFFGRLGNFKTTIRNTEYVIDFECVGVGDASMGIQMYEPFTKSNQTDRTDTRVSNSTVQKWFVPNTENVISPFYSLLIRILSTKSNSELTRKYKQHVNMFSPGGIKDFDISKPETFLKKISNDLSTVTEVVGGFENPIFISWPFFVNVILNDRFLGIRQLYGDDKPYSIKLIHELDDYVFGASETNYDHPNEPLVGSHGRLRSVDAKVMIINNENANLCVNSDIAYQNIVGDVSSLNKFDTAYASTGNFHKYSPINAGTLSHGVWLNAHNIVEIVKNSNTLHEALSTLLSQMNRASANYWNLALDFDEHNLMDFVVVDLNFQNARSSKLQKAYKDAYIFNKPFVAESGVSIKYGSELISADIDIALKASLVASAVYAVQSGTHGHSGNQLSAFSTKNKVPIWDLDITRFYNKRPDIPVDTTKISTLNNNILTKSSFAPAGFDPILPPGPLALGSAEMDKLERQAIQLQGIIDRDPFKVVYAEIEKMQEEFDNQLAIVSTSGQDRLTGFLRSKINGAILERPYKNIKSSLDVETSINDIIIEMNRKTGSIDVQAIQTGTPTPQPARFDDLSQDKKDLFNLWTKAGGAVSTTSDSNVKQARLELEKIEDALDIVKNSPAQFLRQLDMQLSEQGALLLHFKNIFGMIEMMPTYMTQKIEDSVERDANNNFGFNGSLPIKSTLTMAGIGGFRSGEIIRIARLPEPFTMAAFLILGTTDSISPGGWITTLEAKYLPASMFSDERRARPDSNEGCGDLPKKRIPEDGFKLFSGPDLLPNPKTTDIASQYFKTDVTCVALREMIAEAESGGRFGGYNAINRVIGGDTLPNDSNYNLSTNGKRLTEMTIGEVLEKQKLKLGTPGRIFAAGRYQVVPDTLRGAVSALNLNLNQLYNEKTQDRIYEYLLSARLSLGGYVKCDARFTDVDEAALQLAQEWASFPVPSPNPNSTIGYFPGQGGPYTIEEVRNVLARCRAGECKA